MKKSEMIKFLMGLGFAQATAEKLSKNVTEDGDVIPEAELTPIVTDFRAAQRTVFENDADFINKVKGEEKGKQLDIVTRKIKSTFNLDPALIKDKGIEEIITIAKAELTKNNSKDVSVIQEELITANAKIKEFEEVIVPQTKAEVDKQKKNFVIENKMVKMLGDHKLRVSMDAVLPAVNAALGSKYDIDLDDKGEFVVYNKGTQIKPVREDKSGVLGFSEILKGQLETFQFVEKSNAGAGTGKEKEKEIQPEGEKTTLKTNVPHLEAAKKQLEIIKETAEKNK